MAILAGGGGVPAPVAPTPAAPAAAKAAPVASWVQALRPPSSHPLGFDATLQPFNPVPSCTEVVLPWELPFTNDEGLWWWHLQVSPSSFSQTLHGYTRTRISMNHYSTWGEASAPQMLAVLIPKLKDLVGGGMYHTLDENCHEAKWCWRISWFGWNAEL